MSDLIKFRRGLIADLPTGAADGEPLWSTDTDQLYMGNGTATPTKILRSGNVVNADIDASAAIARSKLATGSNNHVIINDGSGNFSSEANLAVSRGGSGAGSFTANNVLLGNGTSAFQVVAPGTSGNVLTSDGTTWTSAAASGGGVYLVKSSSVTRTSTDTLAVDSGSTVNLTYAPTWSASTSYVVQGCLFVISASTTPEFAFQFNGPTSGNVRIGFIASRAATTGNTLVDLFTSFATGGTGGQTVDLNLSVRAFINFYGSFTTSASPGSTAFSVEWAQGTSNATGTTLEQGSWMSITEE